MSEQYIKLTHWFICHPRYILTLKNAVKYGIKKNRSCLYVLTHTLNLPLSPVDLEYLGTPHWKLTADFFYIDYVLLLNTSRTGDADLRFYITTVQDGWRNSAFLKRACFPCTIHLIMQYTEPVSEWSCWRMFIETWPHSELTFRHRASSV